MITVQSAMLVAFGFFAASVLLLLIAPAFWARAVRLTTARLKASMPLTANEIRADKDRLRAEHAVRVHQLETQIERTKISAAHQLIEINRRDSRVNALETELEAARSALEEAANARRVLELTVADRLPRVEQRLAEAKQQLVSRDREIAQLTQSAERQARAIAEQSAINAQLKSEVEHMSLAMETSGARNKGGLADPAFDAEVALRSELETLRNKGREQAGLIGRLQARLAEADQAAAKRPSPVAAKAAKGTLPASSADFDREREIAELKRTNADQATELRKLQSAMAVLEAASKGKGAQEDETRLALKARASALQAETDQQSATIAALRSELAALREQMAEQAALNAAEIKRLGAGTLPAGAPVQRLVPAQARTTLAERVAQIRRDSQEQPAAGAKSGEGTEAPPPARLVVDQDASADADQPSAGTATDAPSPVETAPRPRLLDRISSLSKA